MLHWCELADEEQNKYSGEDRTYTRRYKAKTDFEDTHLVILKAHPEFAMYQPYADDLNALVTEYSPHRVGPGVWEISITWSTMAKDQESNPLAQPTSWDMSQLAQRQRPVFRDRKGRPILSTSGTVFDDPPPIEEYSAPILKGTRNVPPAFPLYLLKYQNAINSDAVRIRGVTFGPDILKAKIMIGPIDERSNISYSVLTMEFEVNPEGWTHYQPNRSYYEVQYESGFDPEKASAKAIKANRAKKPRRIKIDGKDSTEPSWLDKFGRRIDEPEENLDKLIFLPFEIGNRLPFNNLPLR
ncbi:MAG: hypothetical protein NT069_23320 [Planctomycetota bacterium]|nr:hypothetical protein [Planctomycetota bacterium]